MGANVGTEKYPIVQAIPASGALGQKITLATDKRDYYWHVDDGAWRPITLLYKIDTFTFGAGPHALTFNPIPGQENFQAYCDSVFIKPGLYSLASGNQFSLTSVASYFGDFLYVRFAY